MVGGWYCRMTVGFGDCLVCGCFWLVFPMIVAICVLIVGLVFCWLCLLILVMVVVCCGLVCVDLVVDFVDCVLRWIQLSVVLLLFVILLGGWLLWWGLLNCLLVLVDLFVLYCGSSCSVNSVVWALVCCICIVAWWFCVVLICYGLNL